MASCLIRNSIYWCLLFALYVNDLATYCCPTLHYNYADDTELHCSHSDLGVVEMCLQSD